MVDNENGGQNEEEAIPVVDEEEERSDNEWEELHFVGPLGGGIGGNGDENGRGMDVKP